MRPKKGEEALLYPKYGSLKPKYITKNWLTNILEILTYKLNADGEKHLKLTSNCQQMIFFSPEYNTEVSIPVHRILLLLILKCTY